MPPLYLVDTSVWIFALRLAYSEAIRYRVDGLLRVDAVATCGLIELELLGGAKTESEYARLRQRLRGLHRLSIEEADWDSACRLAFSLRRVGVTVPFTDVLLAIIAMRCSAILLHADRDFELIANHCPLAVESLLREAGASP